MHCGLLELEILPVDKLLLGLAAELPLSVALVRYLGVEKQQLDEFSVAIVGVIAQRFTAAIRWKSNRVVELIANSI